MSGYEIEGSRQAYEGALSRVRVDRLRFPGGDVAEREVVEHPDAVAVVPVDSEGRVVLVRQYRPVLRDYQLEIPAGKLDVDGEAPVDAARRELIEEVGLDAGELVELAYFHNSAGWSDESTTVYLGTDLVPADTPDGYTPHAEEADMEVVRLPLGEAIAMIRPGGLADAKTLLGLLLAGRRLGA